MDSNVLQRFIDRQIDSWRLAADNTRQLSQVQTRHIDIGPRQITLQYNPSRRISTAAKTDTASIKARPCFLCHANRPQAQEYIDWHDYHILLNPFPIFPQHLTIAHKSHIPQRINDHISHMAALAHEFQGFTVFYNGPLCGASAPDHLHFQAAPTQYFPIWETIDTTCPVHTAPNIEVYDICPAIFLIHAANSEEMERNVCYILALLPADESTGEPKLNILMRDTGMSLQAVVIPRRAHRPYNFAHDHSDTSRILISPASVDMSGVIISVRPSDFTGLTPQQITNLYLEVGYNHSQLINILRP